MPETVADDVNILALKLLELGGRAMNAQLRGKLGAGWSEERYFSVRNTAVASGLVGLARGRGGIVFLTEAGRSRLPDDLMAQEQINPNIEEDYAKEIEYYGKIFPTIKEAWVQSEGFDDAIVEITASRRVRGAGRWTVPDIVVVGKIIRQYVPGFEFTVQSIEIKRYESLDALAVFEALNHRRAAHFSYLLVVNFPKKATDKDNEKIGQVTQLCIEHDIGLIVVKKGEEDVFDEWNFAVLASDRIEPNPYNLDGFIKQYMSNESKDAIAKMVR